MYNNYYRPTLQMNPCMQVQMYVAYTYNTSYFIYYHQVAFYTKHYSLCLY